MNPHRRTRSGPRPPRFSDARFAPSARRFERKAPTEALSSWRRPGAPSRAAAAPDTATAPAGAPTRLVEAISPATLAAALGLAYCGLEGAAGALGHSSALVADAAHNLLDALALVGVGLTRAFARHTPSPRFTFGLQNASILLALVNAALLLATAVGVSLDALHRWFAPEAVSGPLLIVMAGLGIAANGLGAWLMSREAHDDLTHRGALAHLIADASVSFAVLLSGVALLATGWTRIDALVGLGVGVFIAIGSWPVLKEALYCALAAAPEHAPPEAVRAFLVSQPGVVEAHDLHIWPVGTSETALACHLVMPAGFPGDGFVERLHEALKQKFKIDRATVQIELGA